jgi:hypothetical protein
MNVYDRENVVFYTWDYDKFPIEKRPQSLLPIPIPSFGISLKF